MYKKHLTLNNLQWLMYQKTNKTKPIPLGYGLTQAPK